MNQAFLDYYRCPQAEARFKIVNGSANANGPGYFAFGPDLVCYGKSGSVGYEKAVDALHDVLQHARIEGDSCFLTFNPTEIANNLRYERYVRRVNTPTWKSLIRKMYYALRPIFPVSVRRHMQRTWLKGWEKNSFPRWPVDRTVDQMFERLMILALRASPQAKIPFIWFWPAAKSSCAIMTHDVETETGLQFTRELMDINDQFGIKSSFQIIPDARYEAGEDDLSAIRQQGFEVNVHDLKHDGHLFDDHEKFKESAVKINEFARRFGSKGFRSGVLYRNQGWYDAFQFSYDMSVPNVGHLDPQPGGCCTVMPYFIGNILELPVTTTQDYSLFHVLGTYSQDLWREQIGLIMQQHGLISFIVHPDYLDTPKALNTYTLLLSYLSQLRADADLWIALPGEVDVWWRQRSMMKLSAQEDGWRIEGLGAERARIAYATLKNDELVYTLT